GPQDILPIVIEAQHSRFPVIGDSIDEVLGILLAKDLLPLALDRSRKFDIKDVLRPAIFVPESKRLNVLSNEFRETRNHMPIVIEAQPSRFPVIGDSIDEVLGILLAKDLLPLALDRSRKFDIKDVLRPATFVPESKRLNVLLKEFRETRNHMAFVIDEYGDLAGLCTIEDVLEQIVGDIEDEHDIDDEVFIRTLDGSHFTVKALTPIPELNEFFDSEFPEEDCETIGG